MSPDEPKPPQVKGPGEGYRPRFQDKREEHQQQQPVHHHQQQQQQHAPHPHKQQVQQQQPVQHQHVHQQQQLAAEAAAGPSGSSVPPAIAGETRVPLNPARLSATWEGFWRHVFGARKDAAQQTAAAATAASSSAAADPVAVFKGELQALNLEQALCCAVCTTVNQPRIQRALARGVKPTYTLVMVQCVVFHTAWLPLDKQLWDDHIKQLLQRRLFKDGDFIDHVVVRGVEECKTAGAAAVASTSLLGEESAAVVQQLKQEVVQAGGSKLPIIIITQHLLAESEAGGVHTLKRNTLVANLRVLSPGGEAPEVQPQLAGVLDELGRGVLQVQGGRLEQVANGTLAEVETTLLAAATRWVCDCLLDKSTADGLLTNAPQLSRVRVSKTRAHRDATGPGMLRDLSTKAMM